MFEFIVAVIALAVAFATIWLYDTLNAYCLRKLKLPVKDVVLVATLLVFLGYVAWVIIRFYVTGQTLGGG